MLDIHYSSLAPTLEGGISGDDGSKRCLQAALKTDLSQEAGAQRITILFVETFPLEPWIDP